MHQLVTKVKGLDALFCVWVRIPQTFLFAPLVTTWYDTREGGTVMDFQARLKDLRQRQGWSQYHLAVVSGVPRQVIARLEAGVRESDNMSVGVAKRLAHALGVSVDHLVGMYDEERRPAGAALVGAS